MKPRNEVWCRRNKHRLAWLETDDDGGLVVMAEGIAPGRSRAVPGRLRYTAGELEEYAGFNVPVGCACKKRWSIDVCKVLRGESPQLQRITGDDFPGVSFDR